MGKFRHLLFASTALLCFLVTGGCGAPDKLDDPTGDNGNGNGNNEQNAIPNLTGSACDPGATGTNSDTDPLTDECERILGTNPNLCDSDGDGICDHLDPDSFGGGGPDDDEALRNLMYSTVADSLLLGTAGLTGRRYPNTNISITKQELIISNSRESHPSISTGIRNFCGAEKEKFLYVSFQGTVALCGPDTCQTQGTQTKLELCSAEIESFPASLVDARDSNPGENVEGSVANIKWDVGLANGVKFKFPPPDNEKTFSIKFTLSRPNRRNVDGLTNKVLFQRLELEWEAALSIQGRIVDSKGTNIELIADPVNQKFTNSWQRIGTYNPSNDPDSFNKNPGILGLWANAAPPNPN